MKYVYDIILNFNEKYYDFFQWNTNDNIDYIKKIPVYKVSNEVIRDLILNKIQVNKSFVDEIYNKCEIYTNVGIEKIEYVCLFCSEDTVIGIEFNSNGKSLYKSDLIIDESIDIIRFMEKSKISKIDYKLIEHHKINFITRKEENMIKFIKSELKDMYMNDKIDKLKYIYYECFGKDEINISKINIDLERYMVDNTSKLFDLLKLTSLT